MIWEPPPELVETCGMTRFFRFLHPTRGLRYRDFLRWSVADLSGAGDGQDRLAGTGVVVKRPRTETVEQDPAVAMPCVAGRAADD